MKLEGERESHLDARGLLKDAIEHVESERDRWKDGSLGAIIARTYIREKKSHEGKRIEAGRR